MSAANRTSDSLNRALPFLVVAAIMLIGYFWFVQPRVTEYLQNRTEIANLEGRVRTMQDTVNRAKGTPSADEAAALKLFEERMSPDDRVSDVVELLARTALASAPTGRVKSLQIATGQSATWAPGQAAVASREAGDQIDQPDPRFGLFPVSLTYTPVTVSFEASYEAIERFLWRLQDMPTMIEIRSLALARGLPLMKASVRILVYQRGAAVASPGLMTPEPAGSPSQAPRVARLSMAEGW